MKRTPLKTSLLKSTNWAEIKEFSAHQIANDKTIMLSIENVQKVHFRPKLKEFKGKIEAKSSIKASLLPSLNSCLGHKLGPNPKKLAGTLFKQQPQAQIGTKFKFLFPSNPKALQPLVLPSVYDLLFLNKASKQIHFLCNRQNSFIMESCQKSFVRPARKGCHTKLLS